ncbi:hypothetical protein SAMN05216524_107321 [Mucilaginibacter sp. OK098]|nr:hypothetical protein SAMN05216524_107321 [Mucilaginibacter sp. OK098]
MAVIKTFLQNKSDDYSTFSYATISLDEYAWLINITSKLPRHRSQLTWVYFLS